MIYRSEKGDLHREGLPAIDFPQLKQYFFEGRLHRSSGPAVVTTRGQQYYWRGLHIDASLWSQADLMSFRDLLKIENIELRRALLEKVGFERFEKDAQLLHEAEGDFKGCALFELKAPDEPSPDDRIVFARLLNSTPEPDGTYKRYYLRVPPTIKTLPSAIKWSFDVREGEDWKYLVQA